MASTRALRIESWDDRCCSFQLVEWRFACELTDQGADFHTEHPESYAQAQQLRLEVLARDVALPGEPHEGRTLLANAVVESIHVENGGARVVTRWRE
ncbi:MAG TPA: hypothetical protein VGC54_06115 [Planctomycetota bacterium]